MKMGEGNYHFHMEASRFSVLKTYYPTPVGMTSIKKMRNSSEFPLLLSRLRNRRCLSEDVGLIPGLTQWVKDPALLQAKAVIGSDVWLWLGWQLQL